MAIFVFLFWILILISMVLLARCRAGDGIQFIKEDKNAVDFE